MFRLVRCVTLGLFGQPRFTTPVAPLNVLLVVLLRALFNNAHRLTLLIRISRARLFDINKVMNGNRGGRDLNTGVSKRFLTRRMLSVGTF